MEERRAVERFTLPEPVTAALGTTSVRIVDLSPNGARVQHEERIVVGAKLDFRIAWEGEDGRIRVRIARSEIGGRSADGRLMYVSGIVFEQSSPEADGIVRAMIQWASQSKPVTAMASAAAAAESFLESSNPFLRADDMEIPDFIRCDLIDGRWKTSSVSSPEQPPEGFTISRERRGEVRSLQQVYEVADPETRRMMRNAFAAQNGTG